MQSRSVGTNIHIHVHLEGWISLCNLIATFCIMSSLTHTRSIYQVGINYRMFRNNTTLHLDRFLWRIMFLLKGTYFILGYYLCEDGSTKSNEPFQKPNHHTSVWWKISHAAANQNSNFKQLHLMFSQLISPQGVPKHTRLVTILVTCDKLRVNSS